MGIDDQLAVPYLTHSTIGLMLDVADYSGSEGMGIFRYWDPDDDTNQEISIYAEWDTEQHQIFGADVLYYKISHTGTHVDELYGEDQLEKFGTPKRLRALFNENEITEPNRFYGAWGAMADDVFTCTVTKDEYSTKVDSSRNPMIGDVIKTAWNNINYEITYVREDPGFQYVSNLWAFILKRFEFTFQDGAQEPTDGTTIAAHDVHAQTMIVSDTTTAGDELWIEEASDDLVDYDTAEDLDDDIFGSF